MNSTNITDTAVPTSNAAMYYQTPSYMYMQPYGTMYGATTGVAPAGAMPPAVVPPAVVPPTVMPPAVMPPTVPTGVPPVTMPPSVMPPTVPPSQMNYNVAPPGHPDYNNQNNLGTPRTQHNEPANYVSIYFFNLHFL